MYFIEPVNLNKYKINKADLFQDRHDLKELVLKSVAFITYKLSTGQIKYIYFLIS